MTTETFPVVDRLSLAALDVQPRSRDWSRGYPEDWDYMEAVYVDTLGRSVTPETRLTDDDVRALAADEDRAFDDDPDDVDDEDRRALASDLWNEGRDGGAVEGPMMSYDYPLPGARYTWAHAERIADLPLCIVYDNDADEDAYSLALTGGGMDLSWEICEAFMRLGFLPPVHFADGLPGMAGKGRSETDRWIIAGCRRSLEIARDRASRRSA